MSQTLTNFNELIDAVDNEGSVIVYVNDKGDVTCEPHKHYELDKVVKTLIGRLETECSRNYHDIVNQGDNLQTHVKMCKGDIADHWPNQLMHSASDFVFAIHRFQSFKEMLDQLLVSTKQQASCHCESPDDPKVRGKACTYCQRFGREWQSQPEFT